MLFHLCYPFNFEHIVKCNKYENNCINGVLCKHVGIYNCIPVTGRIRTIMCVAPHSKLVMYVERCLILSHYVSFAC